MPTDLQLKLALAKELPELISARYYGNTNLVRVWTGEGSDQIVFDWRDNHFQVTDREWDWVVRECGKKLRPAPLTFQPGGKGHYSQLLQDELGTEGKVFATWQQRAIAYFKTIGKEVV